MTSTTLKIRERIGSDVSSRRRAGQLRAEVGALAAAGRGPVCIDFSGVEAVSDSFLDELLAVLVAARGAAWFKENVRVVNLCDADRASLVAAITRRREPPSRTAA